MFERVELQADHANCCYSLSKQQREWSDDGSTHSNLSESLHSLIKEQRERSKRGSTHSNLSEPLRISTQTEQAAERAV